jgi:hypothetical protein
LKLLADIAGGKCNYIAFLFCVDENFIGNISSLKRSAPRPAGDKHPSCPTLVQVVGTTFDELVIGGTKDVLLDVYADCVFHPSFPLFIFLFNFFFF